MSKLEEAKEILSSLKVPAKQQNGMCCCVLLAMANLTEEQAWGSAANNWIRIHDVIAFANSNYGTTYAENSRETFRKQAMHHFRNAAFIEDNGKATNSPNYRYRLTDEMLHLIQSFGTADWERSLARFMENHDSLVDLYASKRTMRKMPVKINGEDFTFSPGKHNQLQKAIIEEFAPRFAPNSECLYVGDTTEKDLVKNVDKLRALGFEITLHDKMPDVVLYSEDKDWLYFIESVTSVGPMEPKRIKEIEEMTTGVKAEKIYVTAFLDFKTFKQALVTSFRVFNKLGEHKILSLFLMGDSGVGKTEVARTIHKALGSHTKLAKINFGNYSSHDALNSLIGSPLGYIGSDGGELLKRVQESDVGLILIDEFEKADNAVFNYFLDVLENGKIVNSQADEYDVNGYIIVFTSNISKENFKKKISPELRSRFDYKGMFNLLTDEDKRKFVHFRVNQIISKYREFVSHDLPEKLHDNVVARIDVSHYKNMRDLNKKIKDTFVELIGS